MPIEITEPSEGGRRVLLKRVVSRHGISCRGKQFSARFLRDHLHRAVLIDGGPTGSTAVAVYSSAGAFLGVLPTHVVDS